MFNDVLLKSFRPSCDDKKKEIYNSSLFISILLLYIKVYFEIYYILYNLQFNYFFFKIH